MRKLYGTSPLKKEVYEVRGVSRVEPFIKRLVAESSKQDNPLLYLSVGKTSNKVQEVLKIASDCKCSIDINLLVHVSVREHVLDALRQGNSLKVKNVVTREEGDVPNYMVSKAGYYLQEGINFDEATIGFNKPDFSDFLIDLFEQNSKVAA